VALLSITAGVHRTAEDLIHVGRADFGLFQGDHHRSSDQRHASAWFAAIKKTAASRFLGLAATSANVSSNLATSVSSSEEAEGRETHDHTISRWSGGGGI
jgi:hypothetical protein